MKYKFKFITGTVRLIIEYCQNPSVCFCFVFLNCFSRKNPSHLRKISSQTFVAFRCQNFFSLQKVSDSGNISNYIVRIGKSDQTLDCKGFCVLPMSLCPSGWKLDVAFSLIMARVNRKLLSD